MSKLSHLSLALLLALPIIAGCSSMQSPTPEDTRTAGGTASDLSNPTSSSDNGLASETGSIPADLMAMIDSRTVPPEDILCSVYFDFDQYNIRADQRATLEDASKTLAANTGQRVVAVGYTDWYGSEQYDLALGDRRANSVKSFATKLGVDPGQMDTLSKGKLNAPTNVAKESPEAKQSRVVILVKLPGASAAGTSTAGL
jgi:peptidoglycan-associated lipoprotein